MENDTTQPPVAHARAHTPPASVGRLPEFGFLRLRDIIGDRRADPPIPAVIPVSESTWWAGIRKGRYPKPVRLSANTSAWRVEDIRALVEKLGGEL